MTIDQINEIAKLQRLLHRIHVRVNMAGNHPAQGAWLMEQGRTTIQKIGQLQNQ